MDNTVFSQFSESEQNYAISQLDPFHDTPYRLTGAPSDQASDSITMIVNSEMVVDANTFGLSTAAGSKWDLHVCALPILNQASFYSGYLSSSARITCTSSGVESAYKQLFPISVHGVDSGDGTYMDYITQSPPIFGLSNNVTGYLPHSNTTVYCPRKLRVVGSSFEVVDETPNLYQQGSVTVYQVPSNCQQSSYLGVAAIPAASATYSYKTYTSDVFNGPPNYLSEATILPNSKTWKSKEGAYVIARRSVDCIPFMRPTLSNQTLISPNDIDNPQNKNCFVSRECFNATFGSSDSNFFDSFNLLTHHNTCGAYLSGLSGQYGTYRIRWKAIYEILPDPDDTSLVPLVTPTIPRNPFFEKLLDEAIARLPPGVPQTSNPKGEFWKSVLGVIKKVANTTSKVAPIVGQLTGLPVGQIVGVADGVSNGVTLLEGLTKGRSKRKPNKKGKMKSQG